MGFVGLIPLLETLRKKADSIWMREGSHHVLHDLVNRELVGESTQKSLMPVLDALNHFDAASQTYIATDNALKEIHFK